MRASSNSSPVAYRLDRRGDVAEIRFCENAEQVTIQDENGAERTIWQYDEYVIERPWRPGLAADIENSFSIWIEAAKIEEEARTPVDEWQLRADVDFLQIMQTAAMGIATMSLGSDPDVLEKARQYYPKRWSKEQLQMLVSMQKLSQEDYQGIAGEAFSA